MNCSGLRDALARAVADGWECADAGDFARLLTPFRYPDGSLVELYVEARQAGTLVVTDYGEAFRFLETAGLDPLRSPARQKAIRSAVALSDATLTGGAIEVAVPPAADLFSAVIQIGQAVIRVADLALLARGAAVSTFAESVEEYLREHTRGVKVEANAVVQGASAAPHQFDLLLRSERGDTLVESLSSPTPVGAKTRAAFTVAKFADIFALGANSPRRVAVLDEGDGVWTDELRKQIGNFAEVYEWEARSALAASLTEAA